MEIPSKHKLLDLIKDLSTLAGDMERQSRRLFKMTERVGEIYHQLYPPTTQAAPSSTSTPSAKESIDAD